jgi:hypothetical protein
VYQPRVFVPLSKQGYQEDMDIIGQEIKETYVSLTMSRQEIDELKNK